MIYLFLTPSQTDGRVPSQQGAPTTCNLTYWDVFPAIVCRDVTGQFGYGQGKIQPVSDKQYIPAIRETKEPNPLRHPELSISQ